MIFYNRSEKTASLTDEAARTSFWHKQSEDYPLKQHISTIQRQSQIVSQTQVQFLNILAMNHAELEDWMDKQFLENPLLEKTDLRKDDLSLIYPGEHRLFTDTAPIPHKEPVFWEGIGIYYFLTEQLSYSDYSQSDLDAISFLIANLDEKGFFTRNLKELSQESGFSLKTLSKLLSVLQELEPYGIFSPNMASYFQTLLRKQHTEEELLFTILANDFEDLLHQRLNCLYKKYKISGQKVKEYLAILSQLPPYPLYYFETDSAMPIIPDIICHLENGILIPELNNEQIADYSVSDYYYHMMLQTDSVQLKQYLYGKYNAARLILKNIENRKQTLLHITETLLQKQSAFFYQKGELLPISMAQLADICNCSISTVSRSIHNKYLQYPDGMILMKNLFPASSDTEKRNGFSVSRETVKKTIRQMVSMENPKNPLSDDEIAALLHKEAIPISRRTVAKYRNELLIPTSRERKERNDY